MVSVWVMSFITEENVTFFPLGKGKRYIIKLSRTILWSILKMCKITQNSTRQIYEL